MLRNKQWKTMLAVFSIVFAICFSIPTFFSDKIHDKNLPNWLSSKKLRLGLDLQGGSHILLQVDDSAILNERLDIVLDELRRKLRKEKIQYSYLQIKNNKIDLELIDSSNLNDIQDMIESISSDTKVSVNKDTKFVSIFYDNDNLDQIKKSILMQSLEIVRRRIDEIGTNEPTIQIQGTNRILVQLPGIEEPERIKRLLGKTAKMDYRMVDENAMQSTTSNTSPPIGSEFLFSSDVQDKTRYIIKKRIGVSGDALVDAQPSINQFNQPVVSIRFDSVGSRRFGDLTSKNVGKRFAIVLDKKVISAPVIREAIPGGNAQISGNFTFQTANELAILLRAGSLPAPLIILEERTVGPSLGRDSIKAGTLASLVSLLLVIIYMLVVYKKFGLTANIALIVNIFLIISILSFIGATLTLPGIAGIALTTGMAVDANVLIFERIREESRMGRSQISAIDAGFKQAFRTILDANVTTFIAACILFFLGSGPVIGFAVTLGLGVLTTMYTSLMVNRVIINYIFAKKVDEKLSI